MAEVTIKFEASFDEIAKWFSQTSNQLKIDFDVKPALSISEPVVKAKKAKAPVKAEAGLTPEETLTPSSTPEETLTPSSTPGKTLDDIRNLIMQLEPATRVSMLRDVFAQLGVAKLSEIPAERMDWAYETLHKFFEA